MNASQPKLSVVVSIINFRTASMTIECIRSVLDAMADISARIVVVDNQSGDGSAEQIEDWIGSQNPAKPVTLVRSATNSGFSGGHNQGIGTFEADYYLVLNSDALVRKDFFSQILAAAKSNPDAGLFAPRIEYQDGEPQVSCFRFPSPFSELIRGAASGPVTRLLNRYDVPLPIPPSSSQIGWASFACILLCASMIREIGPMDEGYFLYFEDAEYCWRARRKGWKIVYVPDAKAIHFRGGSGPVKALQSTNKRLPAYYYASRARFLAQAYGIGGLLAANLLWVLGRGLAKLRLMVGKPVPPPIQHEFQDIWINFFSPLGDRRAGGGREDGTT